MHFVFLDESGFTPDWRAGATQQPYYALAAVCIDADALKPLYDGLRASLSGLLPPRITNPLGLDAEVKAKHIAAGTGWWHEHDAERNALRDAILSVPSAYGATVVLVVVDKVRHACKYSSPKDPYLLAFRFALERIDQHLAEHDNYAYCIYDQNPDYEAPLRDEATTLMREGSSLSYMSSAFGGQVHAKITMDRILEVGHGNSRTSLGLQVADFFATFGYQYFKAGQPSPCGWWDTLRANLRQWQGKVDGFGLKVFP